MSAELTEKNKGNMAFLKAFILFSPLLFGGFHIWASAAFSVLLCAYIILGVIKNKKDIQLNVSITLMALILLPLSYLTVSLWAVDSGTAVYGFIKFLPVALFAVIASKLTKQERTELLDSVPYSAVGMGILSYALSFIGELSSYFLVAERLGGFFQYPNTFALYCLVGLVILLTKDKIKLQHWALAALLFIIILLTGSRTVFVFLVLALIIVLFKIQSANKLRLIALFGTVIAICLVIVYVTDNMQTIGRFLTISLDSSTLQGRLLYYKDALPVILKNPFGLGYYGYYFSQGSFQSGVYSVAYIHNDLIQLLLDIGWIPSLLFFFVVGASFFSKNTSFLMKIIILIISGHSFFDFDLQFISVFLLLVLALDFELFAHRKIKLKKNIAIALSGALIVVGIYFALVNSLFLLNKHEAVDKLYGKDTQSKIFLMTESDDYDQINRYADDIIDGNKYIAIAYDAKANYSFMNGDIQLMIEYKWKALDNAAYSIEEYNDFCNKLISVVAAYRNMGDESSAEFCEDALIEIKDRLADVEKKTSSLAWKIKDKPELKLLNEYEEYIARIDR